MIFWCCFPFAEWTDFAFDSDPVRSSVVFAEVVFTIYHYGFVDEVPNTTTGLSFEYSNERVAVQNMIRCKLRHGTSSV